MINRIFQNILILVIVFFSSACQNSEETMEDQNQKTSKVQAVLKIQNIEFDLDKKAEIMADYKDLKSIDVPVNLAPQNKWVMFEGPVLENDLIAYRFYMDSRHKTDIYGKLTKDLVMDTVGWDYHEIKNWGSDILKVGQSLGIGAPGIYYNGNVIGFSDYESKIVSVLENDNDKAEFEFDIKGLKIGGESLDLIQKWSLMENDPFATVEIEIVKGSLPEDAFFCTGIVKHLKESHIIENSEHLALYSWGLQSFHKQNLGMGVTVDKKYYPEFIPDSLNHLVVLKTSENPLKYKFVAAWEKDVIGISTEDGFAKMLSENASD